MNHSCTLSPASSPRPWRKVVDDYGTEVAVPYTPQTDDFGVEIPPAPTPKAD